MNRYICYLISALFILGQPSPSQTWMQDRNVKSRVDRVALPARLSTYIQLVRFKQALKTGIAGVAAIYVARWVRLPEGYWAVISALIVMQSNIGATVSASWNRLISTAIGAAIGGVFAIFWGSQPFAFGAAVALTVLLCASLNLLESYRLAAVTVAIIMLVSGHNHPQLIALHRFLEVSLGIVVGVAVTALVWPSRARESLRVGLAKALSDLSVIYGSVAARYRGAPIVSQEELILKVNAELRQNEDLVKQAVFEPTVGRANQELLPLWMAHVDHIARNIETLELTTRLINPDNYHGMFEPELGALVESVARALDTLAQEIANPKNARGAGQWPDIPARVAALDAKVAGLRTAGELRSYELDEILRFFSFLLTLKTLAEELDLAQKVTRRLKAGSHPAPSPEAA